MGKNSTSKDTVKRPWCAITDMDQYLFGEGTHYELYKKLAHIRRNTKESRGYILQSGHLMQKVSESLENLIAGEVTDTA